MRGWKLNLSLLFVFLAGSAICAQAQISTQLSFDTQTRTPWVAATASAEQVRFTSPVLVYQMRLEVFAPHGEKIFDSNFKPGNLLDWPINDQQGMRLNEGTYLCIVTVKNLSGNTSQKHGMVMLREGQNSVLPIEQEILTIPQRQVLAASRQLLSLNPEERSDFLTILREGAALPLTILAHDGNYGRLISGNGGLSFRTGDFFASKDVERMRLTPEGNLGIGVEKPAAKLDVAGIIRTSEGIMFPDGTTQTTAATSGGGKTKGVPGEPDQKIKDVTDLVPSGLTVESFNGLTGHLRLEEGANISITTNHIPPRMTISTTGVPTGSGTPGKIAEWTGPSNLGDSPITESGGNIGIGTISPTAKLEVASTTIATAVYGINTASNGVAVRGDAGGANGTAVLGDGTGAGSGGFGVRGVASSGVGVNGQSTSGIGMFGFSGSGTGVRGQSLSGEAGRFEGKVIVNGDVGIGTASPATKIHAIGNRIRLENAGKLLDLRADGSAVDLESTTSNVFIHSSGAGGNNKVIINPFGGEGNVGIGTTNPLQKLHVAGDFLRVDGAGNEQAYIGGDGSGNDVQFGSSNPGVTNAAVYNTATNKYMNLFVGVLTVTGADVAEPFDVNGVETVKPGMVVSIDPDQPGRLRITNKTYDRTVAGIVSGANGINPGLMLKQEGTIANGSHPVALTGRVYCWADASNGPIEPGDLLTTSNIPGHAMKVIDHAKAQGAIIGKAMTGLKEGKGLVLVLVTLQ